MNQHVKLAASKIEALPLRQRAMVVVIALLLMFVIADFLLFDPQQMLKKEIAERTEQNHQKLMALQGEVQKLALLPTFNEKEAAQKSLEQLRSQQKKMQQELQEMRKSLVPPEKMGTLLEDILKQNGKLDLVSLKTLPALPLRDEAAADMLQAANKLSAGREDLPKNPSSRRDASQVLYRHGVEITVSGSYPDIVNYLTSLEKMPWQLFWGKANVDGEKYPAVVLTLTVFTLSFDDKWLHI